MCAHVCVCVCVCVVVHPFCLVGNHVKNQEDSVTYADIETQSNKSAVLYADPLDTMGMGYAA